MTDNQYGNSDSQSPWGQPESNSEKQQNQANNESEQTNASGAAPTSGTPSSGNGYQSPSSNQPTGGYYGSHNGVEPTIAMPSTPPPPSSSASPYGQPAGSYGQPSQQSNPYGSQQQPQSGQSGYPGPSAGGASPYGQPAGSYGQPSQQSNPYGSQQQPQSGQSGYPGPSAGGASPYGQPAGSYGQPNQQSNPYGSQGSQPGQTASPYGGSQPGQTANPYGSQGSSGFTSSGPGGTTSGNQSAGFSSSGYGQSSYPQAQDAGQTGYGTAGVGAYQSSSYNTPLMKPDVTPTGVTNPILNVPMVTKGKGLDIMQAFNYGFKATFARPLLWIVGTLLVVLPYAVISAFYSFQSGTTAPSYGGMIIEGIIYLAILLISPYFLGAALVQIDGQEVTTANLKARVNYPQALLTMVLVFLCNVIPLAIIGYFAYGSIFDSGLSSFEDLLLQMALGNLLMGLYGFLVATLFSLAVSLTIDGRAFSIEAIKQSVKAIASVYFPWLGMNILVGIMLTLIALVTCGLGTIIAVPVMMHIQVHAYRQVTQGAYPSV